MVKLIDVVTDIAASAGDISVEIDSAFGTVEIIDNTGEQESIFMQGDEAESFIAEYRALQNKPELAEVNFDILARYLAAPYCENLWN